jgi:hypothetical protein
MVFLVFWAAFATACSGGGSNPTEPTTSRVVTFEYQAATRLDPAVDFDTCTTKQVRFAAHLHFIWNDWEDRRDLAVVGDNLFRYSGSVPVDRDLEIALHDPNNCLKGDVYVAPETLSANGVLLARVVEVAQGTGLAFRHLSDGTIIP